MTPAPASDAPAPLGEQLETAIEQLPEGSISLEAILQGFGAQGLMLLTAMLTLVFLIPVSIPGVSTVFGGAILLIGISRLMNRPLWLPQKLRQRPLPSEKLRSGLRGGMKWVRRLEKVSRPHRLPKLAEGRAVELVNHLAFILAALLLMAPFGFVPFSNTLPALALLCFAIGMLQRDGVAILLGHLANVASIVYFAVLIGGGGLALKQAAHKFGLG
jgi:hypothetical protein